MRLILFVSVDKKMISPHNEGYIGNVLVCAHFSSIFRLLGMVKIFFHVYAQTVLW